MTRNDSFFNEQKEQSQVKARIVEKYFWAWAKVIIGELKRQEKIRRLPNEQKLKLAYIDLFAGPGRYQDGSVSTPILILQSAIRDPDLQERLVTIFNDVNSQNTAALQNHIQSMQGINSLRVRPQVSNHEIGSEIVKLFEQYQLIPTLFFVDPWGYKGLSLRLINSVVQNWGCDSIFFFNYNRINMGLGNSSVKTHMDALFGEDRADELRERLNSLSSADREITIVEEICEALKEMGGKYVLPFRFKTQSGARTSHHLIFVSKNIRGYEIMKEIMAGESSTENQGVASFEYNPATEAQPLLFELSRPLDELADRLLVEFAGQTIKMIDVYRQHHVDTPYVKKNYKKVLKELEAQGRITTDPPASKRKRNTLADRVVITFPST